MDGIRKIYNEARGMKENAFCLVGFNPTLWKEWFPDDPKLAHLEVRPQHGSGPPLLSDQTDKFLDTGGDIFFYLKSNSETNVDKLRSSIKTNLHKTDLVEYYSPEKYPKHEYESIVKSSKKKYSQRILQNSFEDGLVNARDAISLGMDAVLDDESTRGHAGSTYMLCQQCIFNWNVLDKMSQVDRENMIGRKAITSCFIPQRNNHSHIHHAMSMIHPHQST